MLENMDTKHKVLIFGGIGVVLAAITLFAKRGGSASASQSVNATDPTASYSMGGTLYIPTTSTTYNYSNNGNTSTAYDVPVQPTAPVSGIVPTPTPAPTPVPPSTSTQTQPAPIFNVPGPVPKPVPVHVSIPTPSPIPVTPPAPTTGGVLNSAGVVVDKTPSGAVVTGSDYKSVVNASGGLYENHVWTPGQYVGNSFVPSTHDAHTSAAGTVTVAKPPTPKVSGAPARRPVAV